MRKYTLVLLLMSLVLVLALSLGVGLHPDVAKADDNTYAVDFKDVTVSFGDKFKCGSVIADENGYLRGAVDDKSTIFVFDADGDYYIKASQIKVYPENSNTPVALCDNVGRVCVDYSDTSYNFGRDNGTGSFFLLAQNLTIYNYATNEASGMAANHLLSNANKRCTITKKKVSVVLDLDNSFTASSDPVPIQSDGGHTYILHEYGAEPHSLRFKLADGHSLYGTDDLSTEVEVLGNDKISVVDDYVTDNVALGVTKNVSDDPENPQYEPSNNYIVTVEPIYLRVIPKAIDVSVLDIPADSRTVEVYFTQTIPAYNEDLFADRTTQMFYVEYEGAGEEHLRVYFDVAEEQEDNVSPFDEVAGRPTVGIGTWRLQYAGTTVNEDQDYWTFDGNVAAMRNYMMQADYDDYTLVVKAKPITIYDIRHVAQDFVAPDNWVDISELAHNQAEYGRYYDGAVESVQILFGDLTFDLTYEIEVDDEVAGIPVKKTIAQYLADHNDVTSIRLVVGEYTIADAKVNDTHYEVSVHDSLRWQVTPQVLDFAALGGLEGNVYSSTQSGASAKALATYLQGEGKGNGYCVAEFDFDWTKDSHLVSFSLQDKQGATVNVSNVAMANCRYPGYYALSPVAENYEFVSDVIYARVKPVPTTIVVPTGVVYDGSAHAVTFGYAMSLGSVATGLAAYGDLAEWSLKATYNNSTDAPVDAGNYTVRATVVAPKGKEHNPYLAEPNSVTLEIGKASLTVKISASLSKTYGESVSWRNKTSYTVTGLVSGDRFTISCDGFEEEAAPGRYKITASVNNPSNYLKIVPQDANGKAVSDFVVNKLPADDIKTYIDEFIQDAILSIDAAGIHLKPILYDSLPLGDAMYQYCRIGDTWTTIEDMTENASFDGEEWLLGGLEEGIIYYFRIAVTPYDYVEGDGDILSAEISRKTDLSIPELVQDTLNTSATQIYLDVQNRKVGYKYVVVLFTFDQEVVWDEDSTQKKENRYLQVDGDEVSYVRLFEVLYDEELYQDFGTGTCVLSQAVTLSVVGNDIVVGEVSPLVAGGRYWAVAYHQTQYVNEPCDPFAVATRIPVPGLVAADLVISPISIQPPYGYSYAVYEFSAETLALASGMPLTMEELGLSYAIAVEDAGKMFDLDHNEIAELRPNHEYVVVIWSEGSEEAMASDLLCLPVSTSSVGPEGYGYTGALSAIAKYILLGLLALNLLLFVVCLAAFLSIRHKLPKKYNVGGRK